MHPWVTGLGPRAKSPTPAKRTAPAARASSPAVADRGAPDTLAGKPLYPFLMVFGGCKNFLGHSKSCDHNTILYPGIDSRSAGARRCQTDDNGVFANQYFTANKCFEADGEFYTFSSCTSSNLATTVYQTRDNAFYADDNGTFAPPCGVDGGLAAWQALGQDAGSTVRTTPALDEICRSACAPLRR